MKKNKKFLIAAAILGITAIGSTTFMESESKRKNERGIVREKVESLPKIEDNKIIIEPLKNDMKIIRPSKERVVTGEKNITISGMMDPSSKLVINGEEYKPYFTGNFTEEIPLINGENIINVKTNNIEQSFKVNKKDEPIKKDSIIPLEKAVVNSDSNLIVEAKLYDGEKAEAILNGKTYKMKQIESTEYIDGKETSYAKFQAIIKMPKVEKRESLGRVEIKTRDGKVHKQGGEVVVENLNSNMSGVVKENSARFYNGENTSYILEEGLGYINRGTLVRIKGIVECDSKKYYLLESGYRVLKDDIEIIETPKEEENIIKEINVREVKNAIQLNIEESFNGEYILKENNNEISIEFINGKVEATPKVEENSLIKGITKEGKSKIVLKLKEKYIGYKASYLKDGSLRLNFNKMPKSLDGMKIILDPGHGMTEMGYMDSGALGFSDINEVDINNEIAKKVAKILEDKGAKPIVLDTKEKAYTLSKRSEMAYVDNADMFISIHNNSGGSGKLNGTETYYNTSFSKSLAEEINKSLIKAYNEKVFGGNDKNYNRGAKWDYYTVTLDRYCPSVLVEVGYVDNPKSFNRLINAEYQEIFAKSIVEGIEKSIKLQ